ncbi:Arylsulfatase [Neonectria ditissima]|uniref:Arylsulfatase n=1 Tax=Neonectria ditissima TaxID=78410 RepID=A0A0P7B2D3_9HYPO|nr:Arylsulfatase [Neonectria ditissima]
MRYSTWLRPAYLVGSVSRLAASTAAFPQQPQGQIVLSGEDASSSETLSEAADKSNASKKNIVFILTDDQDAVLDSVSYMPLLHKHIADQGTSFINHFTTTAICCPSRVSLWTGKQPHNTNVTDVSPPYGGFPKFVSQGLNDNYLPVWLQEAGYNTYYTGKLFNAHTINNYNSPFPAGWTGTNFLLDPGTYSYLNPVYQRNREAPVQHHGEHTSDLIASYASELLSEAIEAKNPFFLAIAPIAPHSNIDVNHGGPPHMTTPIPAERHSHLFEGVKVPRSDNFNPDSPSGVSWIRKLPQLNDSSVSYIDDYYRARLQSLQAVDELVEQVVTQLDDAGLLDDTYIIYSSDNGFHLGQHRLPPGKECGFDEDIRVPLYLRGPGVAEGSVENTVTTHIDLAPTILKLAGVELRSDFDGTPIPVHKDEASIIRHEHVAVEYWGMALAEGETGGFDGKGQFVIRNNTYKGVRIVHQNYDLYYSAWCNNEHELYDLQRDPGQLHNLIPGAADTFGPENVAILETSVTRVIDRLDSLMLVLKSCRGETCVEPWKILHPRGDVESLQDALHPRFDEFYKQQVKVYFDRCEDGYIIDAEGPQVGFQYQDGLQWHHWT